MIFLLEYDRPTGRLRNERAFADDQIESANAARLAAELDFAGSPRVEIVIIRSHSREEMIRTHGRYFKSFAELSRIR